MAKLNDKKNMIKYPKDIAKTNDKSQELTCLKSAARMLGETGT